MDLSQGSFALEQQLISGLIQNRETTERFMKRKKKHEELSGNLSFYIGQMKHRIFAPIGKKAMMKAELIHTNEITVSLGLGWFVKVSAQHAMEICQRRIKECDEILKKCEAERVLFESRRDAKLRSEAFGGKEIIEKFDEKEEENWRESHKEKIKQHKQQLADVKTKLKQSTAETEEDLWKHLDMLELQEELEDELTRLGEESDEEESDVSEEESETDEEQEDSIVVVHPDVHAQGKKRVTFGLDPVAQVHDFPEEPLLEVETIKTTAIKEEIAEKNPLTMSNTVKSSRPASKFKKSRQGHAE